MSPERRLRRARLGALSTFALAGALCAVWTVRLPALQHKLRLTDAQLGLEVLGWGVGALISMLIAGRVIGRHGSRRVLRIALPGTAICIALVGLAPSYALLIVAGLAFGLCFGLVDVAMNTQASTVERRYGRPLMGGMHAGWSLGAVTGGLVGAATALLGLGFTGAMCLIALLSMPAVLAVGPLYLSESRLTAAGSASAARESEPAAQLRSLTRLPLLVTLFGAIVFCSYLAEGSVADWSGVYLRNSLGSTEFVAALGYPMFEACMFIGRLCSDRLTLRLGARRLLTLAGIAAVGAFAVVVSAPAPVVALVGFACVGLGVCAVTPLAMSLAGAAGGAQTERAIARASTMGYTGLLIGPVSIGFISAATSMHVGYAVVVGVCAAIAVGARFVPRGRHIKAIGAVEPVGPVGPVGPVEAIRRIEDGGAHGRATDRSGDPGVGCEVAL